MRRFLLSVLSCAVMFSLTACNMQQGTPSVNTTAAVSVTESSSATEVTTTEAETTVTETSIQETTEAETVTETVTEAVKTMKMKIGKREVDVTWENNSSVEELKKFASSGLTIKMSKYGGFEQVGSIGHNITSNDKQTKTAPGDIVLYSGNQLVVFYGSNSWAYTRLGKINLSKSELKELLGKGDVTVTLSVE